MIQYLEKLITENWDTWRFHIPRPERLSFIKTCTSQRYLQQVPIILIVFHENKPFPLCVVKMARDAAMNSMIVNEYETLVCFYKKLSHKMKESIPAPLFLGDFRGQAFLIESSLRGNIPPQIIRLNLGYFKKKAIQKNIENVQKWLIQFQEETQSGVIQINEGLIENEIFNKINLFKNWYTIGKKEVSFLEELISNFKKHTNASIPLVGIHGDFYIENMFCQNGEAFVFDWSFAEYKGMPFWDIFMLANSFYVDTPEDSLNSFEKIFFTKNWFSDAVKGFLEGYFNQRGLDLQLVRIFFPFFLIRMAVRNPLKYGIHTNNNGRWREKFNFYVENRERFIIGF